MAENISNLKLEELKKICKEKGLKVSGTKKELIERISGASTETVQTPSQPLPQAAKTKKPKKKQEINVLQKPVIQNTIKNISPVVIKRNVHGNFEHTPTNLVFSVDKKVIGVQDISGEIKILTKNDLENVFKYHFELSPDASVQDDVIGENLKNDNEKEKRIQSLIKMTEDGEDIKNDSDSEEEE
jgi:hypothetical protein